jgi:hypothetical protein
MPEPQQQDLNLPAVEWARLFGEEIRVRVQLDNHEPARSFTALTGYRYTVDGVAALILVVGEELHDAAGALYLLDDGATVTPFYVAGHPGALGSRSRGQDPFSVFLRSFPVGPQFAAWTLGPRKAYHCKVVS